MSTTTAWDTKFEWKAVLVLSLAFGLVGMDRFILPSLAGPMMAELHLNEQDIGSLVGILGMAWGISAILIGGLSDILGRRNILVPAVVLFSLLSVLSGAATTVAGLLLIRAVMGVSEGAVAPVGVAVVVEASHPNRRGINNGFFQCAIALFGLGFAPILATQLLAVTTWRYVFMIVGVPGLVIAVILWFLVREPAALAAQRSVELPKRAPLSQIFKHRNVALAMLSLFCAMTGMFVLAAFVPNYLLGYLKLNTQQMGFVASAIGFGGAIGQLGVPALSDFIGRRPATLLAFVVAAVFLVLFSQAGADNLPLLFGLLFVAAIGNFGALAILAGPIPAEAAPLGLVGAVAGLVIGAGEVFGGGVAPYAAGHIATAYGLQYTLYLALGGQVLGFFIALFLTETAPRKTRAVQGGASVLDAG